MDETAGRDTLGLSRREFLRLGALAVGAGGALAACGSSGSATKTPSGTSGGSTGSTGSTGAATTPKRGGTLRLGISGGGTAEGLNPLTPTLSTDYGRIPQIFEPLISWDDNLQPVPYLAEEITSNADATEWTIRVKSGITFHNGKPLTADDVVYTFQQILNPKAPGYGATPISFVDAKNITKLDSRTVRIPCTSPFSTFMETLPVYDYSVVPVGFDPKKPVGTGPFVLDSFAPGQQSVMSRNPNYWQSGLPYLDKLIMVDFTDETSQTNALSSGAVDAIDLLSAPSIELIKSQGHQVVISNGGGFVPWTMRVDQAPFDDVRVRQALRLTLDRQALLNTVFLGHGLIGNDVFSVYDSAYDHSLPQRQQDISQAKYLLKKAGHDNLHIQLVVAPQAQGAIAAAQVFQQQASAAGVKIDLRQIDNSLFNANYTKWTFANSFWYYNPYFEEVGLATLPTGPFNETHFNDARYNSLYADGLKTVDPTKRAEIAHEMQRIDWESGGYIIPCFTPIIDGLSSKVHGDKPSKSGLSFNDFNLKEFWVD